MHDPGKTSLPRKVFIATRKDTEARERAFSFLGSDFDYRASDPEEAEFIVVDCNDFVAARNWMNCRPGFVIPEPCCPPILLVALAGEGDRDFLDRLAFSYEGDLSNYPVVKTPDELLRTLKWLESIFPFYNKKNSPVPDSHLRELALAFMKNQMVAMPSAFSVQG